jgi:hypothetical protein
VNQAILCCPNICARAAPRCRPASERRPWAHVAAWRALPNPAQPAGGTHTKIGARLTTANTCSTRPARGQGCWLWQPTTHPLRCRAAHFPLHVHSRLQQQVLRDNYSPSALFSFGTASSVFRAGAAASASLSRRPSGGGGSPLPSGGCGDEGQEEEADAEVAAVGASPLLVQVPWPYRKLLSAFVTSQKARTSRLPVWRLQSPAVGSECAAAHD